MKKLVCTAVALAALLCAQPSQAGIGISPRLALPLGDFGDAVGTGFGLSVMMDNIKDKPIRGGLSFLTFGEGDLPTTATAIGGFVGYSRDFGAVYGKIDANIMSIKTEIEIFGIKADETETKIKLMPGIGYKMGKMAAEIDVDIAGDWAGVNLYYMIGGE